jgi:hypothetical protein
MVMALKRMDDTKLREFLLIVCVLMFMFSMVIVAYQTGKRENQPPETVETFELGKLTINMAIFETPIDFVMQISNPSNRTLAIRLVVNAEPSSLSKYAVASLDYPNVIGGSAEDRLGFAFVVHDNGANMTGNYTVVAEGV